MSNQEPVRLSSVLLFKRNFLDPIVWLSTCSIYFLCNLILSHQTRYGFLVLHGPLFLLAFGSLSWALHRHVESFRSFKVVRRCTRQLDRSAGDGLVLRDFLAAHRRYIKPNFVFEHPSSPVGHEMEPKTTSDSKSDPANTDKGRAHHQGHLTEISQRNRRTNHQAVRPPRRDTYRWINKVILFFWPYLSHVVHHQLNEFLSTSSSLARSEHGFGKLIYAFVRQIDANILAVERCELGSSAPYVRGIHVLDEEARDEQHTKAPMKLRKSLVYDLDLVYEGNMNIAFICRYFCCCNSRLGLKDVFVRLSSRLVVGPIDSSGPSIEKIAFSFLELPQFGYKGIALVELAELKIARRSINRLIKEHLLLPKSVSLKPAELLQTIKERQEKKRDEESKTGVRAHAATAEAPGRGLRSSSLEQPPSDSYRLPWTTRLAAQCMFFTCMCSNFCLRFCQDERVNKRGRARGSL